MQNMRGRLAEDLELQAYFLELNKATVKAQEKTRGTEKTNKILEKQEKVRLRFLRLADKLRVKSLQAQDLSKKKQDTEERAMTLDNAKHDVNNDDISIV